ncbi:MAG: TetR/AcrR family transcriptional regulator [Rhodoferax sp.]|nr:TetR/AcrR family transcriptional regulator [Rhodoferax sp.]MDP3654223.1 TetR/AcrR family transcriptional regulator [Rhodoferax sp.]
MARISRAESHAQTRGALLKAAREVFVELGVNAASIDAITERAGYSKGAYYSNFPSKEAIMVTLLEEHMDMEVAALTEIIGTADTVDHLFARLAQLYKDMHAEPSICILDFEYQLLAIRNPEISTQYGQRWETHLGNLSALVDVAATRLHFRLSMQAAELIENIAALSNGLVISRLTMPSKSATPIHEVMLGYLRSCILPR